jgi:hypothetical protein
MGADIPESTLVGWVNAGSRSDRLSGGQSEVRTGMSPGWPRHEDLVTAD